MLLGVRPTVVALIKGAFIEITGIATSACTAIVKVVLREVYTLERAVVLEALGLRL
jgi:hypothetical protein